MRQPRIHFFNGSMAWHHDRTPGGRCPCVKQPACLNTTAASISHAQSKLERRR